VLSVLGTRTEPLFVEAAELLRRWLPRVEEATVAGLGHLLHMQRPEPVAQCIAVFLDRHPSVSAGSVSHRLQGVDAPAH